MNKQAWGNATWYLFHTLAYKLKPEYENEYNDNITQISINYQKSLNQHLILIEGIEVYFPYKPYECQVTYMMKCKLYKK